MDRGRVLYLVIFSLVCVILFGALDHYELLLQPYLDPIPRFVFGFVWWLVNMGDLVTTFILLRRVGVDCELNPVVVWFMQRFGVLNGLLLHKLIMINAVFVLYLRSFKDIVMVGLILIILGACVNNSFHIWRCYRRSSL